MNNGIEKAIGLFGSQAEFARILEIKRMNIQHWKRGNVEVPVKRCVQIEKLTDGVVTRRDLRPDDYWEIWPDLAKDETPEKATE
ncbi:helix-turn-helix domain-containing protein [Simonsiella muelleri]|uniref:transcriptional regulator n=1 Tax=Simonsiella muelleri TaxID=72 RepID=UPI0001D09478|nr:Cro/CI family transcriptional regulator [Simonsiella muelleri]AUX61634.1 hypothetical protein BWP33_07370 [Simonsiella muelleri ATCC 29453]AUX61691.1 hypothetical protein BWP33_07665 [Simonsiella muelleri ATCC 29453]UBQ53701.1 helix-turn-helix domain-containing protein [Simonsiella muelleri]UBQ53763.1 helix-turn-helix domain-containing protein [Simonsiella muelleri]